MTAHILLDIEDRQLLTIRNRQELTQGVSRLLVEASRRQLRSSRQVDGLTLIQVVALDKGRHLAIDLRAAHRRVLTATQKGGQLIADGNRGLEVVRLARSTLLSGALLATTLASILHVLSSTTSNAL